MHAQNKGKHDREIETASLVFYFGSSQLTVAYTTRSRCGPSVPEPSGSNTRVVRPYQQLPLLDYTTA